ncbi:MAG TPA: hypothetical protein VIK91_23960, partial [Nannocystis sp.]
MTISLPDGPRSRRHRAATLAGVLGLVASATLACATCGGPSQGPQDRPAAKPAAPARLTVDIVAFARVLGAVAPCGCTTEPLGGLQYVFGFLGQEIDPQRRLVVEPGGLLLPDPQGPEAPQDEAGWAQSYQRAAALQGRFGALGDDLVSGVGVNDLASPLAQEALRRWPLPRVLANTRALDEFGVK